MPKRTDVNKVLMIGSGPIVIGQAAEFDYLKHTGLPRLEGGGAGGGAGQFQPRHHYDRQNHGG